ncbi:MAG: hypothetical protein AAGI24_08960 [Pseudomonadota bacterium]
MFLFSVAGCSDNDTAITPSQASSKSSFKPSSQAQALLEDQYAYHVGVLAYLYGYPHVDRYRVAHNDSLAEGLPAFDPMRSLGFFETLNAILRAEQPPPVAAGLLEEFNVIGIGPAAVFQQNRVSPARKRGLERAIRDGRQLLEAAGESESLPVQSLLAQAPAHREANP